MRSEGERAARGWWLNAADVVNVFVFAAILTGWLELAVLGFRKYALGRPSFAMDQKVALIADYRLVWILPLAEALTFAVPAVLLAAAAALLPKRRVLALAAAVMAFLTVTSVLFNFTWLHVGAALLVAAGAAVQTWRVTAANEPRARRAVGRAVPWMAAAVLVSAGAVTGWHWWAERQQSARAAAESDAPNVLLVILDTVRSFNLSTYGYERETTPTLTELAQRGVRFEQAYAAAPWTLPSHASLFTGRYPHELSADMTTPLDGAWPTLAEAMSERGYLTAGFVANLSYTMAETGLSRGFAHYEDFSASRGFLLQSSSIYRIARTKGLTARRLGIDVSLFRKDADQINRDFLRWLSSNEGRPFFAFLNYFDAHRPYVSPHPYLGRYSATRERVLRLMPRGTKSRLAPEAARVFTDAYDGALSYLDDRVGRLMADLDRRGVLDNTIVIITSDHGEQFGEHGLFFHANSLYTQLLRVPLLVVAPGRAPANVTVPAPVSLTDVAATVLDLVDREGPIELPGRSLARFWEDTAAAPRDDQPLGAELGRTAQLIQDFAPKTDGQRSVLVRGMHYILSGRHRETGRIREELYDVRNDAREEHDLSATEAGREWIRSLRPTLDSLLPADEGSRPAVASTASRR